MTRRTGYLILGLEVDLNDSLCSCRGCSCDSQLFLLPLFNEEESEDENRSSAQHKQLKQYLADRPPSPPLEIQTTTHSFHTLLPVPSHSLPPPPDLPLQL